MANDKKGIGCGTILLCIFFLPIVLLVAIVKSEKLSKLSKGLIIGGFLFVMFIIGSTSQTDESIDDNSLVAENTINENNSNNSEEPLNSDNYIAKTNEDSVQPTEELTQDTPEPFIISSIALTYPHMDLTSTLDIEETKTLDYSIISNGSVNSNDIKVQIGNSNVVKAEITYIETKDNKQEVTVEVTAIGSGETKVFLSSTDDSIISDISMITVNEPVQEQPKETTKPTQPTEDTSRTVYVTPSGKRYHFDPDCGGKNSSATTLNRAKSSGKAPCQKCAY